MMTETETSAAKRLEAARREVEGWRKGRAKMGPMPSALWAEAISLAKELGVGTVARAFDMNHGALARRVDPAKAALRPKQTKRLALSQFVELPRAPLVAAPNSTVIELTSAAGDRLTVRVSQSLDIGALVANFKARQ
jgi:hypothetical protein